MSSENQKLSSFTQRITADLNGNTQTVSAPRLEATVSANLGNVSNLVITGGTSGQVLVTNGFGGLSWANANAMVSTTAQPMLEFVVATAGNNASFSHPYIASFVNNSYAEIFLNGVLQRISDYVIVGNTLTVNTFLNVDDVITVGTTGLFDNTGNTGNGGSGPAGNIGEIQYNNNGVFGADSTLKYANSTVYAPALTVSGNTSLQNVTSGTILPSNTTRTLGSPTQPWADVYVSNSGVYLGNTVLSASGGNLEVDGDPVVVAPGNTITVGNIVAGNVSGTFTGDGTNLTNLPVANTAFVPLSGNTSQFLRGDGVWGVVTATPTAGGSNTQVQFNDSGLIAGNTGFTYDKSTGVFTAPKLAGDGGLLSNIAIPSVGNVAYANFDGNASNVLSGANTWVQNRTPSVGNVGEVQLAAAGNTFTASNAFSFDVANGNVVIGTNAVANAANSFAIGAASRSLAVDTIAIGRTANAAMSLSMAIGQAAVANATQATAIGVGATAQGISSTAIGSGANVSNAGVNGVAIGQSARAFQTQTVAIGDGAIANGSFSVSIGWSTSSTGFRSAAIGATANATAFLSYSIGGNSVSSSTSSYAIGSDTRASALNSYAIGTGANANVANTIVLGTANYQLVLPSNQANPINFTAPVAQANTTATVQARLPILINGVQYYIMLTQ